LKPNPLAKNPQTLSARPARLPRVAMHNACADAVAGVAAAAEDEAESKQSPRLSLLPPRKALPPKKECRRKLRLCP
jgi:hypothetical protein